MRPQNVETWLRRAGAIGVLISAIAVYSGVWRGLRHPKGRVVGPAPAVARILDRGNEPLYVAVTGGSLAILYLLWRPVKIGMSAPMRMAATIVGAALYFPGLAIMVWGRATMGEMHNISTSLAVQLYEDHRLVTSGPFALVRHPMYLGGIMAELGALLLYRTWTTVLAAFNAPALLMRAHREEDALAAEFGEQWTEYAGRVPRWIPRLGS
jgi:protein-S-isoprenylcysteine O-methyltransferase Ste14